METAEEVGAGGVCAITGLLRTFPGRDLAQKASRLPGARSGTDLSDHTAGRGKPGSHASWTAGTWRRRNRSYIECGMRPKRDPGAGDGEVQIEVLSELIRQRYGVQVTFWRRKDCIQGDHCRYGGGAWEHFEPPRHYAEVHLCLNRESREVASYLRDGLQRRCARPQLAAAGAPPI